MNSWLVQRSTTCSDGRNKKIQANMDDKKHTSDMCSSTNLVLFFDGTSHDMVDTHPTNIRLLYQYIDKQQNQAFYISGVGVNHHFLSFQRIIDGTTGLSVSYRIKEAYSLLALHYRPGQKIYLFGFSRGAFIARTLAGMIRAFGIIKRECWSERNVKELFRRYIKRKGRLSKDVDTSRELNYFEPKKSRDDLYSETDLVYIHFMGLFDTVPGPMPWFLLRNHDMYWHQGFHRSFCHLMAENVTTMYQHYSFVSNQHVFRSHESDRADKRSTHCVNYVDQTDMEVLCPGDHSNVGGGWVRNPKLERRLSNSTLKIMAARSALNFDEEIWNMPTHSASVQDNSHWTNGCSSITDPADMKLAIKEFHVYGLLRRLIGGLGVVKPILNTTYHALNALANLMDTLSGISAVEMMIRDYEIFKHTVNPHRDYGFRKSKFTISTPHTPTLIKLPTEYLKEQHSFGVFSYPISVGHWLISRILLAPSTILLRQCMGVANPLIQTLKPLAFCAVFSTRVFRSLLPLEQDPRPKPVHNKAYVFISGKSPGQGSNHCYQKVKSLRLMHLDCEPYGDRESLRRVNAKANQAHGMWNMSLCVTAFIGFQGAYAPVAFWALGALSDLSRSTPTRYRNPNQAGLSGGLWMIWGIAACTLLTR